MIRKYFKISSIISMDLKDKLSSLYLSDRQKWKLELPSFF